MNSCRNERNIETGNYPIVEIKMILIQPEYLCLMGIRKREYLMEIQKLEYE